MPRGLKKADVSSEIERHIHEGSPFYVSPGNEKLDSEDGTIHIPNMSLLPGGDSCPGATPLCRDFCYARQVMIYSTRAMVRWTVNDYIVRHSLDEFYHDVWAYLRINPCQYFRVHVAGDFYNQYYLNTWVKIAEEFPKTRFLAFTKSFHLDFSGRPNNLVIMWSVFPDTDRETIPPGPRAYTMLDDAGILHHILVSERPRMDDALMCIGGCASCGHCFHSDTNRVDVKFNAHGRAYRYAVVSYNKGGDSNGCDKEDNNDQD